MKNRLLAMLLVFAMCLTMAACGAPAETPEESASNGAGVIAVVVTGDVTTEVTSIDELVAAVDPSGNTQITLKQNVTGNKPIRLPYSCSVDFNGFTIATSPNDGNGIEVVQMGAENEITTIKNGTLTQYGVGVRVNAGGVVIENMTISSRGGAAVEMIESKDAYKDINSIKNSTLSSESSCIMFCEAGSDFSKTGITVENSTLISHDADGAQVFSVLGSGITPGVVTLGENVELYSYSKTLAPKEGYFYGGQLVNLNEQDLSVEVDDTVYNDIRHWSTQGGDDVIDVLMIGNSFCYYFVQELYGIADAADVQMNITNLYEAGCFVEEHWNWLTNKAEGEGKYEYWVTNSMGRWKPYGITSSYHALDYRQWDVITLQQHFKPEVAATYDSARGSCDPYVKDLYDYLKKEYSGAKLYWHETWAYQVGHEEIADAAAQKNQQNNIIRVSEEICQENGVDMIPGGEAWVIARANSLVGDSLCLSDMYHDGDVGGGQYLNACVWFEVLTGKSCVGNTWRPDYELSEERIAQLQLAAHQAVAECYGEDYAK